MATVAHVIVKSQMEQTNVQKCLPCHTLSFAAPMTLCTPESWSSRDQTKEFVRKISDNTCNIVYKYDPIPHAFGDLHFLVKAIECTLKTTFDKKGVLVGFWSNFFETDQKMLDALDILQKIIKLNLRYRQIGKILYYSEDGTEQEVLSDIDLVVGEHKFREHIELPEEVTLDELDKAHQFYSGAFANKSAAEH